MDMIGDDAVMFHYCTGIQDAVLTNQGVHLHNNPWHDHRTLAHHCCRGNPRKLLLTS